MCMIYDHGHNWWEAARLQLPHPNQNANNTSFVGIMISNIVCGLPLSQNHSLKLVDDQCIRLLEN
jgi:hypothetical protein